MDKARIFLLVDLRDIFFRFMVGGDEKNMVIFRAFFFSQLFFLISPETVKVVIGKPTVCIKSYNILSFS